MYPRFPLGERILCFLCDYGLVLLAVLFVSSFAIWWSALAVSPTSPDPGITPTVGGGLGNTSTPRPYATNSPQVTPAAPIRPEFVLVFIPVDWQSGQAAFERTSSDHADVFIGNSSIELYFSITVVTLPEGLQDVSLSDVDLDTAVYQYGLISEPGDRYIGITDGDLSLNGDDAVAGWTSGGQALVAEAEGTSITAHELGHTFGLCDEYSFSEWLKQNKAYPGGCPNPYPSFCPRITTSSITCNGEPTSDGRNSIMGPAGLHGEYGFNDACLAHLLNVFESLSLHGAQ